MALPLNPKAKTYLEDFFNNATMNLIMNNDSFVVAINQFYERYALNGSGLTGVFEFLDIGADGAFDPRNNNISIRIDIFQRYDEDLSNPEHKHYIQLEALSVLAHELGHAISSDWYKEIIPDLQVNGSGEFVYPSVADLIERSRLEEGRALYHQYNLLKSLAEQTGDDRYAKIELWFREDGAADRTLINFYKEKLECLTINGKSLADYFSYEFNESGMFQKNDGTWYAGPVFYDSTTGKSYDANEVFEAIGIIGGDIAGIPVGGVFFTYDEFYALDWLKKREPGFAIELMERHGLSSPSDQKALEAILANPDYLEELKDLLHDNIHIPGYGQYDPSDVCPVPSAPNALGKPDSDSDNTSPIILDMDGDGVETVAAQDEVYFDHDGNRFAEKTGWAHSHDALLVHDKNGNGLIDDGSELFGNNTVLANGQKAPNGFEALKEMDSNLDGVVDNRDAGWGELKLWQDKNGNGVLDTGELLSMEEAGVAGLNVGYKHQYYLDANGNEHRQVGTFIRDDGSKGQMTDVWFTTDIGDTQFMDEIEVNADIAKLPDLKGYGNIPSLHQVMAADESGRLQTLMEQYLNSDPVAARAMAWDIIFAWTGVIDLNPNSRGGNVGDARKLYAMEKIWGEKFNSFYNGANPGRNESRAFQTVFADWEAKIASYFLLSTHYNGLYKLAVQAVTDMETGMEETEAVTELVSALREMYGDGNVARRMETLDFLLSLRTYDAKGIAFSSALKSIYGNGQTADEFEKWIALSLKNVFEGFSGDDRLNADSNDAIMLGRGGDDLLYGANGHNVLDGGSGNDHLFGGAGDDIYLYAHGYGNDTIDANDSNTAKRDIVRLVGLNRDEVEFRTTYNGTYSNLLITILATGETLTILNGIYNDKSGFNRYGIAAIEFGDGTILEWAELEKSVPLKTIGSENNDTIYGSRLDTVVEGKAGDDTLHGKGGNDELYGGAGNDTLYGNAGHDLLDAGSGNDSILAGAGDDTYLFHSGDGQDTINNTGGGNDRLSFTDINPAELWFGKSGNHLSIGLIGTSDKVTVNNWFVNGDYKIDSIEAGGLAITENQVALMVQAMATLGAPGGADGQWTAEQQEALTPILASYWQPRV